MRNLSVLAAAAVALCAACTHIDEGTVDYRVAQPAPMMNAASLKRHIDQNCNLQTDKPTLGVSEKDPVLERCDPLLPSPLVRRFQADLSGTYKPFKKGDFYSIDIMQGVMGTRLLETPILGREFGSKGQFAVLANVFEFASSGASDADLAQRRFIEFGSTATPTAANPGLKLIYYSGDVQRRQPFNFSNIPLRARGTYSGNSVAVQLVVIEIDNVSGPVREMLSTLADFGQSALPGPAVGKEILLGLGKSLMSGSNNDDRLLEYRMVLSPGFEGSGLLEGVFAPGQYVIRRAQTRNQEVAWGNVRLDHNTGRLFTKDGEPIRDDLYFTLNIKRYPDAAGSESYAAQDWGAFRQTLSEAADAGSKPLKDILPDVQKLVATRRTEQWRGKVLQAWEAAKAKSDFYAAAILPAGSPAAGAGCAYHEATILARNEEAAGRDARQAVIAFVSAYQSAMKSKYKVNENNKETEQPEFAKDDQMAVINAAAPWFMPWGDSNGRESFDSAEKFSSAYNGEDAGNTLWALAKTVAERNKIAPLDCDEIVRRGFGYFLK